VSVFRTQAPIVAKAESVREQFTGERHLLANYARAPIEIVRGEGCELIDAQGNRYLDMVAGIAVCALGHARPEITAAIAEQAATLVQASNLFYHEPSGTLANKLAARSGLEHVFFSNSGTEANEAAIKLARKLAYRKGETQRFRILSCEGSFHGRTFGALAATANPHYKEGFEPLPGGFAYTPFNDIAALEQAIDETVAAFIVEPVQGESGVKPADPEFLAAARRLCDRHGALLIFDEIQCGMGRVGTLFAFQTFGVRPDVVTLAKSLANGLPIGAALREGLQGLHERYPAMFAPPRGLGLMLGLPVREPYEAKAIVDRARVAHHLLLNAAGDNTLRFVPPLVISNAEIAEVLARLARTVAEVAAEGPERKP